MSNYERRYSKSLQNRAVKAYIQRSGLGDVADFGKRQADKRKVIKVNESLVYVAWLMFLRRPETEASRCKTAE